MVRKCRAGLAEIAVMEVAQVGGIKTRTRVRDGDDDDVDEAPPSMSTKRIRLDSDHQDLIRLRNHQTALLDHHQDRASTSCSGSSDGIQFVDLEDDSVEVETSTYYSCGERREATSSSEVGGAEPESEELDSKAKKSEANSRRGSTVEKMPTEVEIEEFFVKAEKQLQKEFAERYNYDIVKDEPMEGRYEWIRIKP